MRNLIIAVDRVLAEVQPRVLPDIALAPAWMRPFLRQVAQEDI